MELTSILSAASGLKTAGEMAQALLGMKLDAVAVEKVAALRDTIMTAQGHAISTQSLLLDLAERLRLAEEKIAEMNDFSARAERYELHQTPAGSFVYKIKASDPPIEKEHTVCANCYAQRKLSILQVRQNKARATVAACPRCQTDFFIAHVPTAPRKTIPSQASPFRRDR